MTYKMFDEDLKEIVAGEYFHSFNRDTEYFAQEKTVAEKYGSFKFKESHFKDISISNCQYSVHNNIRMYGKTQGEMICLSLMNKGSSGFSCGSIGNCIMDTNTVNLFYLAGENLSVSDIEKGNSHEVTDVVVSKEYVLCMAERYPEIFEPIHKKIVREQNFALYQNGVFANSDIHQVMRQIKESGLLGNAAPLYIEAKIQELFALLSWKPDNCISGGVPCMVREKMYEAKFILEKNYLSPPGINELARQVGVSGTTMKTCFKKMFNNTVYGYLFDFRMKKAEQLLDSNTDLNISEIAELTGYEHIAHFSTAFKRKFGVTPSEYREKAGCSVVLL